jgi:integrase
MSALLIIPYEDGPFSPDNVRHGLAHFGPLHFRGVVMASNITTVSGRDRLKPQAEPYWHKVDAGLTIGFRKMTAASPGAWLVRIRDAGTGERIKRSLGPLAGVVPAERYTAALREAQALAGHVARGGSADVKTVCEACAGYVKHVRARKGDKAAGDIAARFRRWVDGDPVGAIDLPKLGRRHLDQWRERLSGAPVVIDPHSTKQTRARSPGTVNRDATALRAALNHALDLGHVTSDMAWRVALRPTPGADKRRDAYLTRDQRKALIDAAPPALAQLLRACSILPLRPGAVAGLTVADLDQQLGVLRIGKDKAGQDRRIALPPSTLAFLADCARDKLPAAPLIARADGGAWDRFLWSKGVTAAAAAAGLPAGVTLYALRHAGITDLVTSGLDLMTVAQLSGTSVAMIEAHYAHLQQGRAAAALATLAL